MKCLLSIFCFLLSTVAFSQMVQRSTVGMGGNSTKVTQGDVTYYVASTVGQQSAIGSFSANGISIRQGFQQPPILVFSSSEDTPSLTAVVYPNPVFASVTVKFSDNLEGMMSTQLFDVQGRQLRNDVFDAVQEFTLDMSNLSSGVYILTVLHKEKQFTTRLLKN